MTPFAAACALALALPAQEPRTVAVTFDDLPAVRYADLADARRITTRILDHTRRAGVPAIGFVNEGKLAAPGVERDLTALLEAWLEAGHELGNHTYSHMRLYDTTLAAWTADILRGEAVTRRLLEPRGRVPRYFRHPTLNTGRSPAVKDSSERFLAEHGYTVAPVTIDNDDYIYARAYDLARARGDSAVMRRLGADYVRYMEEIFVYAESLSTVVLGRAMAHTLLLHANGLNADYGDAVFAMIARRGYRFVTLDEALRDPAYRLPDRYVGRYGFSWLRRWAVTRGTPWLPQPDVPDWVAAAARS